LCELFDVSNGLIIQAMTFNSIGVGVGELCYGTLSDKFGRKKIFVLGCFIYALSNFFCIYSTNVLQYFIYSTLQGLSSGFTSILYASIRDMYKDETIITKYITITEILFGVCLIVSPFLGSIIFIHFSWKGNYIFLFLLSVIISTLFLFFYRENKNINSDFKGILKSYKSFISNKDFALLVFLSLLACFAISIHVTEIPFINNGIYKISPFYSGMIVSALNLMYVFGNIINMYLLRCFCIRDIIKITVKIFILAIFAMFTFLLKDNFLSILIPFMVILLLSGILFPNSVALTLNKIPYNCGIAGSFIGSAMYFGGGMVRLILGLFNTDNYTVIFSMLITTILIYVVSTNIKELYPKKLIIK
jgi:DHA1 family bicyclomycin/chloramphenicol resistance-like MFS transporter